MDKNTTPTTPTTTHHIPQTLGDRFAFGLCKLMRAFADLFFRKRYLHRAVVLETVAAVPGLVGAVLQHLKSLRVMRDRHDLVKTLMDESENERMHLMAFVALCQPTYFERLLVVFVQGIFFNAFFVLYLCAPRVAHRLVGYFEEEAVVSYDRFLSEIDAGHIENVGIPEFAKSYWGLAPSARLKEMVQAVRQDEMNHRDVNHQLSHDISHQTTHNTLQANQGKSFKPVVQFG